MGRALITSDDLDAYVRANTYHDHPVMPATRLRLGYAIAHAERFLIAEDAVLKQMPRLLETCLTDEDDPLRAIAVLNIIPSTARHRPHARRRRSWLHWIRRRTPR